MSPHIEYVTWNFADVMPIADFQRARDGLEVELKESMSASLRRFQEKYGIAPDRITVDLQTVQMIGDAHPKFMDCAVSVKIKMWPPP